MLRACGLERGIPVEVSCWKLMRRKREDGGRETGRVDVSLVALQLPHDNGSLLEKNFA